MVAKVTRSPRAPSFTLEESVKNAVKLYDANGKHSIPADVAAKALGYSGANNGSAARALASMKSFGLLHANNKGDVAVSPDIEAYRYAPDDQHRQDQLIHWLRAPKIYDELLNEYHDRLPSDQVIRYKLIKMGFLPTAAEECLKSFRASVNFADYFAKRAEEEEASNGTEELWGNEAPAAGLPPLPTLTQIPQQPPKLSMPPAPHPSTNQPPLGQIPGFLQMPPLMPALASAPPSDDYDRILVRLSKGRRAWIEVPRLLYAADKEILKNQINLILTDDEDESEE